MTCSKRDAEDHCCYVKGEPCEFLEENIDGHRWTCGLWYELGSWDAVIEDPRYQPLKKFFAQFGYDCKSFNCKDCK